MSKIRKLAGFASAFALAIAMLPAMAFADTSYYDLYVNGERFTSDNLAIECGEGTATYDPATQTLTLDNASITNALGSGGIYSGLTSDLNIVLQGENRITFDDNMGVMATGNIELSGSGSHTIDVAGETKDGISAAGNVSVHGTTTRSSRRTRCMRALTLSISLSKTAAWLTFQRRKTIATPRTSALAAALRAVT